MTRLTRRELLIGGTAMVAGAHCLAPLSLQKQWKARDFRGTQTERMRIR
jgi:hypothetical protein